MGRVSSLIFGRPDVPVDVGSSIPRSIRMGSPFSAQPRPGFESVGTETRGAARFVPRLCRTFLTLAGGKKIDARIINMSSRAVAVEADFTSVKPEAVTMVGSQPVRPGRKIKLGAVFVFARPLDPSLCTEDFVI